MWLAERSGRLWGRRLRLVNVDSANGRDNAIDEMIAVPQQVLLRQAEGFGYAVAKPEAIGWRFTIKDHQVVTYATCRGALFLGPVSPGKQGITPSVEIETALTQV
jgi:hypothetical protein